MPPFPHPLSLPTVNPTQIKPTLPNHQNALVMKQTRAECQPHPSPFLPRPQMLHSNTRYICRKCCENEQAEDPKKQSEGVGLCTVPQRSDSPPCFFFLHPFHHERRPPPPPSLSHRNESFGQVSEFSQSFGPAAGDTLGEPLCAEEEDDVHVSGFAGRCARIALR